MIMKFICKCWEAYNSWITSSAAAATEATPLVPVVEGEETTFLEWFSKKSFEFTGMGVAKETHFFQFHEPHLWNDHTLADGWMTFIMRVATKDKIYCWINAFSTYGSRYQRKHLASKAAAMAFMGYIEVAAIINAHKMRSEY